MNREIKTKILLAEDDEGLLEAFGLFLASRGYEVTPASDGLTAFREVQSGMHDILITDLNMPGLTGEILLERISEMPDNIRPAIIVVTGHGTLESAIKGISAGVSAYIHKPFNFTEAETAIKTAAEKRRLEEALKNYYRDLDRKVEERTRELSLLNSFSEVINHSFDVRMILEGAVENMSVSMEADVSWIYLLEGNPPLLKLTASRGFPEELLEKADTLRPEDGYSGRTFRDGKAFIRNGPPPDGLPISAAVASQGFTSSMHAAVRAGEEVLGTMGVASRTGKIFTISHLQLLTSFGNQIGAAISKVRFFENEKAISKTLENKINQLFILNSMGSMARVSTSLTETSLMLVSSIAQAIGFDRVCLWLLDKDKKTLSLAACQGGSEGPDGSPLTINPRVSSSVDLGKGEPVIVSGSPCGLFLGAGDPGEEAAGEFVMAPLVVHDPETVQLKCWEHYKCAHATCPAHKGGGLACWMVPGSCMKKSRGDNLLDKMEICRKCQVYIRNTSGKSIGLICADNKTSGRQISQDDLKVLSIFANSAATIVENLLLMEKLLQNEKFTDSIITNMASGLMVTDLEGRVQMINKAGAETFKSDPGDLMGKSIGDLFPETRQMLFVEPSSMMGREITVNIGGADVPIGYTSSFLTGYKGKNEGTIVLFKDLSDIVKLREQLREKDRFAAIGKVAAGVAHEIRNPLFGITSVAQILARETKDDAPVKELINAMLSETSRLNTLVEDMLLYGRSMKLVPQPVEVGQLIESVLLFHQAAIEEKNLIITKSFGKLPQFMLDQNQMRQVLLNLLVNAIDASSSGGEIRVGTKKENGELVISISDDGIGIPRSDLHKVFDLFYTTKEKGTGLGLAICRKIIEDHGGSVNIDSMEGKGTTVELRLKERH